MRRFYTILPLAAIVSVACTSKAQNESSRQVANGGISVSGWTGQIDANEASRGQALSNAKLDKSI
jgi:GH25 family lysozyme M1 (1,4-beta-N-acetylmuramidase)